MKIKSQFISKGLKLYCSPYYNTNIIYTTKCIYKNPFPDQFINSDNGIGYQRGFHIFSTIKATKRFLKEMDTRHRQLGIICQVLYDNVVATGKQSIYGVSCGNTIVAQKMKIIKEIE